MFGQERLISMRNWGGVMGVFWRAEWKVEIIL